MNIFVVNELCEIDSNYNNCYKAFTNKDKAIEYAKKVFKDAINDLHGEDCCIVNIINDYSYQVYNDEYNIEVHVDEIELEDK